MLPDGFLASIALVAASEMGDKTQLLAFSLASRFRKPWPILAGILAATLVNHGLSAWAGAWVTNYVGPRALAWILAITFFACGAWALIPDKLDEEKKPTSNHGAFLTTFILFFLAELGDKTQIATVSLGARYQSVVWVTAGTTIGMMITDSLAVFLGDRIADKVQMKWVRWVAAGFFMLFGVLSVISALKL